MTSKDIIADAELCWKTNGAHPISDCYFHENPAKTTAILIRYVCENIFHYTPQEALRNLDFKKLEALKLLEVKQKDGRRELGGVLAQYVITTHCAKTNDTGLIPPSADEDTIINMLLSLAYDEKGANHIKFDKKNYIIKTYQAALPKSGKRTKETEDKSTTLPKCFFSNKLFGEDAAYICMLYAISRYMLPKLKSIEACYEAFGTEANANKLLKQFKLSTPANLYFGGSGLEYFHRVLVESQRDEFLYRYYKFNESLKKARDEDKH